MSLARTQSAPTSRVYVSQRTGEESSTGMTGRGLGYSSLGGSCEEGLFGTLSDIMLVETDDR